MFSASVFLPAVIACLAAYLLGSLSAAIIVSRALRLPDPRTTGSGNPGTTNVLRTGGKGAAALTLLGDALKGFAPVFVTGLLTDHAPTIALVAVAAFIGHLYPVFFQFRGGKGVATALGGLLGLAPGVGLLAVATWLAVCLTFRMSSLAALITFLLAPAYLLLAGERVGAVAYLVIALFLFYSHRSNIRRILAGNEARIGRSR